LASINHATLGGGDLVRERLYIRGVKESILRFQAQHFLTNTPRSCLLEKVSCTMLIAIRNT